MIILSFIGGVIVGIIISVIFFLAFVFIVLGGQLRNYDREYKKLYGHDQSEDVK